MATGNLASLTASSQSSKISHTQPVLDSFSTALVLLPPPAIQARVNGLRVANDKSYPRWTAHVTLIFPFISRERLPLQLDSLRKAVRVAGLKPFQICLDAVGHFRQRDYDTVYLGQTQTGTDCSSGYEEVHALWRVLAQALGYQGRDFIPHMTLGQTSHKPADIQTLQSKGELLLIGGAPTWTVNSIAVLQKDESDEGRMKIIDELYLNDARSTDRSSIIDHEEWPSFEYSSKDLGWVSNLNPPSLTLFPDELNIMTFNILHDPVHLATSRFNKIRTVLLARDCDILCLQEVTDAMLSLLLGDELIRSRWTWCTRGPNDPMENERNIVIFAKQHIPFQWRRIPLGGKRKAAAILTLKVKHQPNIGEYPHAIVLAVVHLTAGLNPVNLDTKAKELSALINHLQEDHSDDEWIIAGDTNFPSDYSLSSLAQDVLEDVWESHTSKHTGVYNATYDPVRNNLAAQTAREDRSPQRYDRLYIKRGGRFQVRSVEVLESAMEPASDHWPLRATLHLSIHPAEVAGISPIIRGTEHLSCSPRTASRPLSSQGSEEDLTLDAELWAFAQASRTIPNATEIRQRKETLQTLSRVIGASLEGEAQEGQAQKESSTGLGPSPPATSVQLVLVPVGSFALSVDFPDSDLDCSVIGNISPSTFWALVKQRLYSQAVTAPHGRGAVALKRFVKDAAVQMMVLEVEGIKIDMQYCPAAEVAENWPSYSTSLEKEVLLPVSALRVLNAHRDRLRLQTLIPYPHVFQLAYRSIKIFCIRHGIFASRFGYLGGIHLSILLCRLTENIPDTASGIALVRDFFRVYSNFDWANDVVSIRNTGTTYRRSPREPLVILSPERPVRNVSANASVATRQTISTELLTAHERLSKGEPWSRVCGDARNNVNDFLDNYDEFVKVDLGYWGDSCMAARSLIGFVESRLVHLLVDLHDADGPTAVRLWPERLTDLGPANAAKGSSIHGFYLLGLRRTKDTQNTKPLIGILQAFEESIRRNQIYFDASNCFILASECVRSTLGEDITVDVPIWSDGGFDEPDDNDEGEISLLTVDQRDQDLSGTPARSLRSGAKRAQNPKVKNTPYLPAEKLRTSSDVYNRLMWDPQLDQNDYSIGYEDRFDGVKEVALKSWKRNVEDEAFIPFHRVVYFRCKSSGEIVWDRRSKLDHVFGSGTSHQ